MENEKAVLGACFLADGIDEALSILSPEDFGTEHHRAIFSAIQSVSNDGGVPDIVTVTTQLHDQGHSEISGYVADLVESVPTAANIGYYAKKLKEESTKRRLVEMAATILNEQHEGTPADILDIVHKATADDQTTAKTVKASTLLRGVIDDMERRAMSKSRLIGHSTGIGELDELTSGLCNGDMIILAARPSIGKTAMALNLVEQIAVHNMVPTLFLSLEMSQHQLVERLVLSMAKVDRGKARAARFEAHEFGAMTEASGKIHKAPLWIDKSSGCNMAQLKAKARAAKRRHGIGLVVIDYLGLVRGKGTEYEIVTEASKDVKDMASELDVAVICLHQLNRGSENRTDKKPTMADLRSSGQIEQDADVILFLHRKKENPVEEALVIVEKQRNGPTGQISVTWHGPHNRYFEKN